MDLPDNTAVIIQANEALSLPDNLYTILSSTQMREHGVEVNDKAKRHYGKQNLVVDGVELPLTLQGGLLHLPLREPTDEDLIKWPIVTLTSDQPWDPKAINDHEIGEAAHVSRLSQVIGMEAKADLTALVHAVRNSYDVETSRPAPTEQDLETYHPT